MSTQFAISVVSRRTEPARANRALRLNCRSFNILVINSKVKENEPWHQPEPETVIYR